MLFYRDKLEIEINEKPKTYTTRENHVVEEYVSKGVKGYFVTLYGTHWCAHGATLEQAISDALWKDESKRPSLDSLKEEIVSEGKNRPITLNEFKLLTGACSEGCKIALKRENLDGSPMVIKDILKHFPEWGKVLCEKLGWDV